MEIRSDFDGGNIHFLDPTSPLNIQLEIVPDDGTSYLQCFYFRIDDAIAPSLTTHIMNAHAAYVGCWENYHPPSGYSDAIGTNFLSEYFGCVCMTLEMPFMDTTHKPDQKFGWSSERSKQLGRDNVLAMLSVLDALERKRNAWQ